MEDLIVVIPTAEYLDFKFYIWGLGKRKLCGAKNLADVL